MSIIRYELTIHLTTKSPLHSGGMDVVVDPTREGVDREAVPTRFARDAHGHPILTGRSVKGAVRAACTRYLKENPESDVAQVLTEEAQARLWGDGGKKAPNGTPLRASALTFHKVRIPDEALVNSQADRSAKAEEQPDGLGLPNRLGIAMNRYWGAVGDGALFVHEFVPRGNALELVITGEGTDDAPGNRTNTEGGTDGVSREKTTPPTAAEVKLLLELIVGLFRAGQISFGGRQGAGWGRVALDEHQPWQLREYRPDTREGLMAWLSDYLPSAELKPVDCGTAKRTRITIEWTSPTGVLVADPELSKKEKATQNKEREKAHAEGKDFDAKPIPTMPLRDPEGKEGPLVLPGSSVRGALRARASRIGRTVLVGARGKKLDDWSDEGVHEQLAADPTLVRDLFGTTERRGALTVLDTHAASADPRIVTHNAGDRWTGGVAEGALYSEEVHDHVKWDRIVLELDPDRLPQNRRSAAWCLLGLVLAELSTGTLPLGSRGTRGLGQVEVTGITVEGLDWLGLSGDGTLTFPTDGGQSGRDVAAALLTHLREVNKTIKPNGDAKGWSSYLIEAKEKNNA